MSKRDKHADALRCGRSLISMNTLFTLNAFLIQPIHNALLEQGL